MVGRINGRGVGEEEARTMARGDFMEAGRMEKV